MVHYAPCAILTVAPAVVSTDTRTSSQRSVFRFVVFPLCADASREPLREQQENHKDSAINVPCPPNAKRIIAQSIVKELEWLQRDKVFHAGTAVVSSSPSQCTSSVPNDANETEPSSFIVLGRDGKVRVRFAEDDAAALNVSIPQQLSTEPILVVFHTDSAVITTNSSSTNSNGIQELLVPVSLHHSACLVVPASRRSIQVLVRVGIGCTACVSIILGCGAERCMFQGGADSQIWCVTLERGNRQHANF